LSKLFSLHQARPELLRQTALVASLPSWLSLRLGGPPILDRNLAAMSGLYSLKTGDWSPTALELCGLKPGQLPRLVDCGEACSVNSSEPGFLAVHEHSPGQERSKAVTIHSCGNDQTCGALAAGLQPGEVLLTLGTALVVYRLAGSTPGPYSPSGCWGPYPGKGYYELLVSSKGTSALDWACKEFFPGATLDDLEQLASSLPAALAQAPPFFFPQVMGTPVAISHLADPPALAWSVYEGLSFSLRRLLDAHAGPRPALFLASGGGSSSQTWLQMISNVTGVPVWRCTGLAGSPLLGAAIQVHPEIAAQSSRTAVGGCQPDPAEVLRLSKRYQQWLQFSPCEGGCAPKTGA
jgi:xylulokinase